MCVSLDNCGGSILWGLEQFWEFKDSSEIKIIFKQTSVSPTSAFTRRFQCCIITTKWSLSIKRVVSISIHDWKTYFCRLETHNPLRLRERHFSGRSAPRNGLFIALDVQESEVKCLEDLRGLRGRPCRVTGKLPELATPTPRSAFIGAKIKFIATLTSIDVYNS